MLNTFLFFILLMDPFDTLKIKSIILLLIIFLGFYIGKGKANTKSIISSSLFLSILIYFLLISILYQSLSREVITIAATFAFLSIFILFRFNEIYFESLTNAMLIIIYVNFVLLLLGFATEEYALLIYNFFKPYNFISYEHRFGLNLMYHNSIFFCIMALPYLLDRNKRNKSVIILLMFSFILSLKKSIYVALFAWYILFLKSNRLFKAFIMVTSALLLYEFKGIFDDESSSIRLDYIDVYYDIFSNPAILLFGHGLSVIDWHNGIKSPIIEFSYIEVIRYFGVLVGVMFIYLIFKAALNLIMIPFYRLRSIGVLIFLVEAAFNPLLWGILGLPLIAIMIPIFIENKKLL